MKNRRQVLMEFKINTITDVVDKGKNKKAAAVHLGVTLRTINRMINKYKEQGPPGLIHHNTGKKPANIVDKDLIFELYRKKYYDLNIVHFTEILKEFEHIKVCEGTVRNIFKERYFLSPKAHKKTQRDLKKKLKEKKKLTVNQKDQLIQLETLEFTGVIHPTQPRCKYFGEELQLDASNHLWFGNKKAFLHSAIDDATGIIVGAYFDWQETLKGYYNVLKQILTLYGIPILFKTDRRTIFEYKSKKVKEIDKDTFTQFSHACRRLGIDLQASSKPEFKARVERSYGTLQGRLPQEMRLANISTLEQANEFLQSYISKFNERFALTNGISSCFEKQPSKEQIEQVLVTFSERIIDRGHAIKLNNKYYFTVDKNGHNHFLRPKTKVSIIKTLEGKQFALHNDSLFALEEIEEREKYASSVDFEVPMVSKPKQKYIPPYDHPWRLSKTLFFQNPETRSNDF